MQRLLNLQSREHGLVGYLYTIPTNLLSPSVPSRCNVAPFNANKKTHERYIPLMPTSLLPKKHKSA
jgi:hypothetical protein